MTDFIEEIEKDSYLRSFTLGDDNNYVEYVVITQKQLDYLIEAVKVYREALEFCTKPESLKTFWEVALINPQTEGQVAAYTALNWQPGGEK